MPAPPIKETPMRWVTETVFENGKWTATLECEHTVVRPANAGFPPKRVRCEVCRDEGSKS